MALKKKEDTKAAGRDHYSILLRPVITEKSSLVGSQAGGVVFRVRKDASKDQIKEAIEKVFKVEVAKVRTCNVLGKMKRTTRSMGRRDSYKKAYVTLKKGHTIDLVEGV